LGVVCCNYLYRFISVIIFTSEWGNIQKHVYYVRMGSTSERTLAVFATISKHLVWIQIFAIQFDKPKHRNKPNSLKQISDFNYRSFYWCVHQISLIRHTEKLTQLFILFWWLTKRQGSFIVRSFACPPPKRTRAYGAIPPLFFTLLYFTLLCLYCQIRNRCGVSWNSSFWKRVLRTKFEKHWCRLTTLFLVSAISSTFRSSPLCPQK
jgi:hypothetical protein